MTGRMVEATEAHVMGLVNYIVTEQDELLTKTRELLSVINDKAPLAIARIIECANIAAGDGIAYSGTGDWEADPFGGDAPAGHAANGFLREQQAFGECFGSEDLQEGAAAFLEKRKPHFKGK
jgi:enoyl-CoA hydratase